MKSYNFGIIAEYIIAILYFFKFYKIIKHRYKTYLGEIDLIAVRNKTIVFIEVKARTKIIDDILCKSTQQERIKKAAIIFLQKHGRKYNQYNVRFDLAMVRTFALPEIIENAWE